MDDNDLFAALLESGQQIGSLDPQIAYQQAMSQRLRAAGATPQMRMSGRIASAPRGLEYLGALVNQGMAGNQDRQVLAAQQQQNAMRNAQVQQVLDYLRRGKQPAAQPGAMTGNPDLYGTPQAGV